MAKIYVSQSSVRPLRWLLRILGWVGIAAGIYTLFAGRTDFVTIYMPFGDDPIESIGMGAFLVILDLLLPDPYRKARRVRRKCERIYKSVCKTLPYGEGLNQLLRDYGRAELVKQITRSIPFCQTILNRYPCRQVLEFIHTCHPEAAYAICIARQKTAKTTPAAPEASASTPADTTGSTTVNGSNVSANTDSRIQDINALLGARSKKNAAPVKGTPLKQEDIQLGPMLDQYWHGCDYYDAANHRVMKYICIPDGPQGFGPIKVPEEIETLEQLLPWLVENHDFHLKEED